MTKMAKLIQWILLAICVTTIHLLINTKNQKEKKMSENTALTKKKQIKKVVLENGITVLILEDHTQPKVSIQMFYHVGSKDEKTGEKGIAHLIEHMLFKGTNKAYLHLSESDINAIVQMLSGTTNAFTTYDYTGYLFNIPSTQWKDIFPIIADCMKNAEFDDQKINSEMKAVIQELKMYRDSYTRSLLEELLSLLFLHHPYHYPIIGYKKDLWSVSGKDLLAFYKKYYTPPNATLIVVGDIQTDEVIAEAKKSFGSIASERTAESRITFAQHDDVIKKSITLYREVEQPVLIFAFSTPGFSEKQEAPLALLRWILAEKRHCRLHKKLVDELQLAVAVSASYWSLFEHTFFFILCYPKKIEYIPEIEKVVADTLVDIAKVGVTDDEMRRAIKNYLMETIESHDEFEEQAYEIGRSFLGTKDPLYTFNVLEQKTDEQLKLEVEQCVQRYLRPAVMNTGILLPAPQTEKIYLEQFQQESDELDTAILKPRIRTSEVELPRYAERITPKMPRSFIFPKAQKQLLDNGLRLLMHESPQFDRITVALQLKADDSYYEPNEKPGLYRFMAEMLDEGTKNYTAEQLAEFLEMRAMSLSVSPGSISIECLKEDFESALIILKELVTAATFPESSLEKIRDRMQTNRKLYWDDPRKFSGQLFRNIIYKDHPWSKDTFGTQDSIATITKEDLEAFYQTVCSPVGARLAIVGAVSVEKMQELVKYHLGTWRGNSVPDLQYPPLSVHDPEIVDYHIKRDQVVLTIGNLSIDRQNPDFEKLLIFDQIFGGGVLGSMMSRLFQLREASGLFYTITGSSINSADDQPGMFLVKTIVSRDRLDEAIAAIKKTIKTVPDSITDKEVEEAKRAILYAQVDFCATSRSLANYFLTLDRLALSDNYYDQRYERFAKMTKDDVIQAVKKYIDTNKLVVLRVGRI
jgi:zinc protease